MPTRYERLRKAVRILAAPAVEQIAYLDALMSPLTGGGSAVAYGNNELALSLDDLFIASNDMILHGELTEGEAAAIRSLDQTLSDLSGDEHASFWRREALSVDKRWNDVRLLAAGALAELPKAQRAIGRSDKNVR